MATFPGIFGGAVESLSARLSARASATASSRLESGTFSAGRGDHSRDAELAALLDPPRGLSRRPEAPGEPDLAEGAGAVH